MFIAHELPFRLIEHDLFKAFLASLQPKFKLHGRITLKNDIMNMYQNLKENLTTKLSNVNRISLTTDLWTSSNQTAFMVVSSHYITDDWKLKKRLISFKELPSPHTGLAISDQLISTMVEWKILDKVAFITVDNASANDVAIARVSSVLQSRSKTPPDLNGKFLHVCCAAHVINLLVKDGLKII